MRYFLILLACCSGLLAQSPLLDPTSWVWGGRDPDLTFEWHCESTTAEYSVGDTSGTLVGSAIITNTEAYDGTSSLLIPTSYDYATFDVTDGDLGTGDSGTVTFAVRLDTIVSSMHLVTPYSASSNYVSVQVGVGDKLFLRYVGTTTQHVVTNSTAVSTGVWHTVSAKWRTNASPYLSISVDDGEPAEGTSELTPISAPLTSMHFGETANYSPFFYLDDIRVYKSWK
jgi:hypothetical protein